MSVQRVLRLALPLLGLLFYCWGMYHYSLLCRRADVCQITCGSALTREDCENIQKTQEENAEKFGESPPRCVFWKKTESADAENPRLHRSSSVNIWKVWGSPEVLFGEFARLQEEDGQGCLLDEKTAQELFGSAEALGGEILCGGRRLTVRGVLKEESAVLVVRLEGWEGTDHIALENASPSEVQNFQLRYGISGTAADSSFLKEILQLLLLFFPVCLAVCVFRGLKGSGLEVFRWGLLFFMLWFLLHQMKIPESMIPDKWSNFQFWQDGLAAFRENLTAYARQEKTGSELARIVCFSKGAACAALAVFSV